MAGEGIRLASAAFLDDGFLVQQPAVNARTKLGEHHVGWPAIEPAGAMEWMDPDLSPVTGDTMSNGPTAGSLLEERPHTFSWDPRGEAKPTNAGRLGLLDGDIALPSLNLNLPCFSTPLPPTSTQDTMLREIKGLTDYTSAPILAGASGRQGAEHGALQALMTRQFALPHGRGPVLARSRPSFLTEQQGHVAMCTEASVAAQNHAHVRLDLSAHPPTIPGEAASTTTAWPEFHAGVCDGLSYADLGTFGRTWIAYNAPTAASYWFSGVLYGLGLAGNLSSLSGTDMYKYLHIEHDATVMGFLLGVSASKRGSMDEMTEKNLRLHHQMTPVLQELGILSHIGSIVGFGLLYQKTHKWGAVNKLLALLDAQDPSDEVTADQDFEARNIAIGIAIGLVMMGYSDSSDMRYARLMKLLRPPHPIHNEMNASPSSGSRAFTRGYLPAVRWLSLGLMFLGTGGPAFSDESRDWKFMSEQFAQLALFQGVSSWNQIDNTEAWIWNHLPANLQAPRRGGMDAEIAAQLHESHCFYVSGSALAVGIKYAGTHDMQAASSIASVIQYLLKKGGTVEAEIVDNCLGICALGLAVVLAGSGDMKAFRIIRNLLRRIRLPKGSEEPNLPYIGYGAYSALSQALGFLFLGGGECTFGQSIESAAYLLISLFPFTTTSPADNRHYLQAYRHLYVLAMEKRKGLEAKEQAFQFQS